MARYNNNSLKENKGMLLIATAIILNVSACQADSTSKKQSEVNILVSSEYLVKAEQKDIKLELLAKQGKCAIRLNDMAKIEVLNIPYPCGFVHHKDKPAQTFHYKDVGQVFAIAGSIADKSAYTTEMNVSYKHKCSSDGQAITIRDGKITLFKSHHGSLKYCHNIGFDEKDFYGFSHF